MYLLPETFLLTRQVQRYKVILLDFNVSGGEYVDAGGSRSRNSIDGFYDDMQIYITQVIRRAHTLVKRGVSAV